MRRLQGPSSQLYLASNLLFLLTTALACSQGSVDETLEGSDASFAGTSGSTAGASGASAGAGGAGNNAGSGGTSGSAGGASGSAGEPTSPGGTPAPIDVTPPVLKDPNYLAREFLGRPTDSSVTVNVVLLDDVEAYFEYSTTSGKYSYGTTIAYGQSGVPIEAVLVGLPANTKCYYRLRYRLKGSTEPFLAAAEHSFHTQRAPGESFTFIVQADPHLDEQSVNAVYSQTLSNAAASHPDFMIDLGDVSMVDKCVISGSEVCLVEHLPAATYAQVDARNLLHRAFYGEISPNVPVFLSLGNHEGEAGWRMRGDANTYSYWDIASRKLYYPNPTPDDFYEGSSTPDPIAGLRENYYSWVWGDALFVVVDAYGYGTAGNGWGYSMGDEQYAWFKKTLQESTAAHKFVFLHQLIGGGMPGEPGASEGRGGKAFVDYFEWGGKNADGTEGFKTQRPKWDLTIKEIMESTGVSILFHGHDHIYAKEDVGDMVYLEVPQPSHPTTATTTALAAAYGYTDAVAFPSSGHVRVTVSAGSTKVEYVRTFQPSAQSATRVNNAVLHSFTTPAK